MATSPIKHQPISLRRKTRDELNNAIGDLEKRGFVVCNEPREITSAGGYQKGEYDGKYMRHGSGNYNPNTFWFCKMNRSE